MNRLEKLEILKQHTTAKIDFQDWVEYGPHDTKDIVKYIWRQFISIIAFHYNFIDWYKIWEGNCEDYECCVTCCCMSMCGGCSKTPEDLREPYTHCGYGCPHIGKTGRECD